MVEVSEKPISKEKHGMICIFFLLQQSFRDGLHSFIFLNSIHS